MKNDTTKVDTAVSVAEKDIADKLLYPLWSCIDPDYKSKYRKNIWEQFENVCRSSAYTNDTHVFIENFKKRFPIELEAKHANNILLIVDAENSGILEMIRKQTTYLVMLVRLRCQNEKEEYRLRAANYELQKPIGQFTIGDNGDIVEVEK